MAKVTLNDIVSGFDSTTAYNTNNDLIETGFDNTLSRDGSSPNSMEADLDLNSNDLLNASSVHATEFYLNGSVLTYTDLAIAADASVISYSPVTGPTTNVESALNVVETKIGGVLYVENYATIQLALDAWVTACQAGPAKLVFDPSVDYTTSSQLTVTFTTNVVAGCIIDFQGAKITSTIAGTDSIFKISSQKLVRGILFDNMHLLASGNEDYALEIDGGDNTLSYYLYNIAFMNTRIHNAKTCIRAYGNFFESTFYDSHLSCKDYTSGYGYHFTSLNPSGGYGSTVSSSIDIYGGSTRSGIHGIYSNGLNDLKVFGGTYIQAASYNINMLNCIANLLSGVHSENAQHDAATSTGSAAINVTGQCAVRDCLGAGNNTRNTTLVRAYADSNGITVDKPRLSGGQVVNKLEVVNGSSQIETFGVKRSEVVFANTAAERVTSFNNNKQKLTSAGSVSGSIDINVDNQEIYEVTITGATTINAPTNPVAGDRLVLKIAQDGTGGHVLTLNGIFKKTITFDTAAGTSTIMEFYYTGGAWLPISEITGIA